MVEEGHGSWQGEGAKGRRRVRGVEERALLQPVPARASASAGQGYATADSGGGLQCLGKSTLQRAHKYLKKWKTFEAKDARKKAALKRTRPSKEHRT
eukprot:4025717-Pleurochrysis_carterae.AAC.1